MLSKTVTVVSGPAGVGKSRFAHQAINDGADAADLTILIGAEAPGSALRGAASLWETLYAAALRAFPVGHGKLSRAAFAYVMRWRPAQFARGG